MKRYLILILLCAIFAPLTIAQDDPETHVEVVAHLTIETPLGFPAEIVVLFGLQIVPYLR